MDTTSAPQTSPGSGSTGSPFIIVQLNAKELVDETVQLISTVRDQVKSLSEIMSERLNGTLDNIGSDLEKIVGNVEGITAGINRQIEDYSHPFLFSLLFIVFLLILTVLLLFFILKTKREFRKRRRSPRSASTSPRESGDTTESFRQLPRRFRRQFNAWRRAVLRQRSRSPRYIHDDEGTPREGGRHRGHRLAPPPPPPPTAPPHYHHPHQSPVTHRPQSTAVDIQPSPSSIPSKRQSGSLDTLV